MKQVAKLVIVDNDNKYLLMYRSDHPSFPYDADLPGGLVEPGESLLDGVIREVAEEAGIALDSNVVTELYSGTEYSAHDTHYSLYHAKLSPQPDVTLSWEHAKYEWLDLDEFLEKAKNATDTYMHMVHNVLKS